MDFRRIPAALAVAIVTAFFTIAPQAQEKPQEQQRKLSNEERREYIALSELVDAVASGKQPAPADLKLQFFNHFLKSNEVYIPYVLQVDGKFRSFPVAMYVRAMPKEAVEAVAAKADEAKPGTEVTWPFADFYFLTEKNVVSAGEGTQVSRALQLTPGEYTLYIALRERQGRDKKQPPQTVVLAQPLSVPDMSKGLTTSSVILAKELVPAPEQLTGEQQLEQPYTISGYRVTPLFGQNVQQSGELLFVFFIHNQGVAALGKPDLEVEYLFFRASEDKPFTRLATQSFNAKTLPDGFDLNKGHQVFVGQGIPLKNEMMTFAPGDYRMEIKITDKTNGQTITRNVPFAVVL